MCVVKVVCVRKKIRERRKGSVQRRVIGVFDSEEKKKKRKGVGKEKLLYSRAVYCSEASRRGASMGIHEIPWPSIRSSHVPTASCGLLVYSSDP